MSTIIVSNKPTTVVVNRTEPDRGTATPVVSETRVVDVITAGPQGKQGMQGPPGPAVAGEVQGIGAIRALGLLADGLVRLDLRELEDAGGGELVKIQRDGYGRLAGTSAATTDDLAEGIGNLYYSDVRVDTRVQAADYSLAGAWSFAQDISISGMRAGLGPGASWSNVVFGSGALASRTTANNLVAIGYEALKSTQAGGGNTAIGFRALTMATGANNTAIGAGALRLVTANGLNTAIGAYALQYSTGIANTAIGVQALSPNTTGSYNTAIGSLVGSDNQLSGSNNTWIGYIAGSGTPTQLSYSTAIGSRSSVTTSNTVVLGRTTDNTVLGATGDDGSGAKLQVTGAIKSTSEYRVGSNKVLGARDTGWATVAGTSQKGGGSTYAAPAISASPTQAEVQAIADALQAAHRTIKALTDALTTHGIIGA